ncbi:hypothetical protein OG455_35890 [Kitasatospora sp. NBC_01287]|uniref:hypothetical protein n=1 Tax=Kitasatospora sp. NBC_01287 TaxID=2903573 RepID=UPI00225867A7|nr:hypothetical protein [Kitasatospora sp. NBC_01287]MCX4750826.1 hypothetical protein [Kitasatospora sp. NBC_01287]
MHHPLRRTLPALAALGIAVTAPLLTAGPAQAHEVDHCDSATVEYSVDNGATWQNGDRMAQPHGTIQVKLDGDISKGCSYQISLASYSTEGPTWPTSGTQSFLGWATTTLSQSHRQAKLDVSGSLPPCFGQIDLYSGGTKFDGTKGNGPLPKYPNGVFSNSLISAWNGGTACQGTPTPTPSQSASPSASASGSTSPSPSASTSTSPSPSGSTSSSPSGSPSPSASTSGSTSPSPSVSASTSTSPSASASVSTSTKPSSSASAPAAVAATPSAPAPSGSPVTTDELVGSPSVQPVSATPTGLAFTGTNGGQLVTFGVGGAVLIAAGVGAVLFTRRRSAQR